MLILMFLPRNRFVPALLAFCCLPVGLAQAGESAWTRDTGFAMRLLATGHADPGALSAGVQVQLEPGFKTYWRTPGDSGVPPKFDWSGSTNLREARVLWPAPVSFEDGGGRSLGYTDEVVFPVELVPVDPAKPINLSLHLEFAVCEKLCLPAEASAKLRVEPSGKTDPALERLLGTHRSRVPLAAAVGGTGPLAVESVSIDRKGGAPALAVTARAPAGTALELAIETPEDLALPSPPPSVTDAAGKAAFRIELPTAKAPADGTGMLTLSDGDRAVEVPLPLALLSGH